MNFKILIVLTFLCASVSGQDSIKHLYLGNDTHTDLMRNGDEEDWYKYTLDMAKFYLNIGESTQNSEKHARSKWNYDVAWTVYMLEKRAPKELFGRFIEQLKNGQASVPFNFVSAVYGASTLESTLRSMYYGGYLERKYGIPMVLAVSQENATLPLGLASLWAGCGAKYSWKGVCNCATKVNTVGDRDQEIYWYTGLDGSRVLMKWYSNYGWNAELGGYAEMLEPTVAVQQMNALCDTKRYPYKIAGAFGKGWDSIHNYAYDLVWALGHRTLPGTKVHLSNQIDFFEHFESEYGEQLPEVTLAHGNEWDLNLASLAEVNAALRRSMEKLRTAEAMAAIVSLESPDLFSDLDSAKKDFYYALGVFNLHGWTADGPIDRHDFATYMRGQQQKVTAYVDALSGRVTTELARRINAGGLENVICVFNALNWERDEIIDIPLDSDFNGIRDLETGETIIGIIRSKGSRKTLTVQAKGIPSTGYKLFQQIQTEKTNAAELKSGLFTLSDQKLETPFYKVELTRSGAIRSLIDKKTGVEWADGLLHNLGGQTNQGEKIKIESQGRAHITLFCRSNQPVIHESKITFYRDTPRIDFEDTIVENFADPLHWSFGFNVENSEVWHEEVGAVINAKTQSEGGHYADRMARYDYLTLNHFLNVSNGQRSMTLSNRDCLFFRLGDSKPHFFDTHSSEVHVLIGGQINDNLGVIAQDGDSLFHQNFSLMPHDHAFDAAESMRFALEHQNPVLAHPILPGGEWKERQKSFIKNDNKDVLLWALKPAEENGVIARLWNQSSQKRKSRISFANKFDRVIKTSHVETDIKTLAEKSKNVVLHFNTQELQSIRILNQKGITR